MYIYYIPIFVHWSVLGLKREGVTAKHQLLISDKQNYDMNSILNEENYKIKRCKPLLSLFPNQFKGISSFLGWLLARFPQAAFALLLAWVLRALVRPALERYYSFDGGS